MTIRTYEVTFSDLVYDSLQWGSSTTEPTNLSQFYSPNVIKIHDVGRIRISAINTWGRFRFVDVASCYLPVSSIRNATFFRFESTP